MILLKKMPIRSLFEQIFIEKSYLRFKLKLIFPQGRRKDYNLVGNDSIKGQLDVQRYRNENNITRFSKKKLNESDIQVS